MHFSALRRTAAVLVLLTITVSAAGCSSTDVDQTRPGGEYEFSGANLAGELIPASGRALAPSFDGELLDGTSFESADLGGAVTVINFWGSWCAPCRVETPDFQTVYADVRDRNVQFLGVDVKDNRQMAGAFMSEVGAEYPSLFDPRDEVAMAFRGFPANVVPSTILLDADGRVAAVYAGAVTREQLRSALDTLLGEAGR